MRLLGGLILVALLGLWLIDGVHSLAELLLRLEVPVPIVTLVAVAGTFGLFAGILRAGKKAGTWAQAVASLVVGIALERSLGQTDLAAPDATTSGAPTAPPSAPPDPASPAEGAATPAGSDAAADGAGAADTPADDPVGDMQNYAALGWIGVSLLYLAARSPFGRAYRCAYDGKQHRVGLFSRPVPCPGAGNKPHTHAVLICPTCAQQSPLCKPCAQAHGCSECRDDLTHAPRCEGPLDQPSQCFGGQKFAMGVHLCSRHYPEVCPKCAWIRGMLDSGRPVSGAKTCAYCLKKAGWIDPSGFDYGPIVKCYNHEGLLGHKACEFEAHVPCFEQGGSMLCPSCELKNVWPPEPAVYGAYPPDRDGPPTKLKVKSVAEGGTPPPPAVPPGARRARRPTSTRP